MNFDDRRVDVEGEGLLPSVDSRVEVQKIAFSSGGLRLDFDLLVVGFYRDLHPVVVLIGVDLELHVLRLELEVSV